MTAETGAVMLNRELLFLACLPGLRLRRLRRHELNIFPVPPSYNNGRSELRAMPSKNERVELEMKIMRYRDLARKAVSDPETVQRIAGLIAELEQKLREIDE